jgi:hypothetical protein
MAMLDSQMVYHHVGLKPGDCALKTSSHMKHGKGSGTWNHLKNLGGLGQAMITELKWEPRILTDTQLSLLADFDRPNV